MTMSLNQIKVINNKSTYEKYKVEEAKEIFCYARATVVHHVVERIESVK